MRHFLESDIVNQLQEMSFLTERVPPTLSTCRHHKFFQTLTDGLLFF
jgi:hypothetical protein